MPLFLNTNNVHIIKAVFLFFMLLNSNVVLGNIGIVEIQPTSSTDPYKGSVIINASGSAGPFTATLYLDDDTLVERTATQGPPIFLQFLNDGEFIGNYTFDHLIEGDYYISVIDRYGCETILEFEIYSCSLEIRVIDIQHVNLQSHCQESTEPIVGGQIHIDIEGEGDYSIIWTGPQGWEAPQGNNIRFLADLPEGRYMVHISTEDSRCDYIREINITHCKQERELLDVCFEWPTFHLLGALARSITMIPSSSTECNGSLSAEFEDINNISHFYWEDSEGNFLSEEIHIDNLCPGTYSFIVNNGCSIQRLDTEVGCMGEFTFDPVWSSNSVYISGKNEEDVQQKSFNNANCILNDAAEHSLELTNLEGGEEPYTFEWSDGVTTSTPIRNDIAFAEYSITITDNTGCVMVADDLIRDRCGVTVIDSIQPCPGFDNGSVTFKIYNPEETPVYIYHDDSTGLYLGRENIIEYRIGGLIAETNYEIRFRIGEEIIVKNIQLEQGEFRMVFVEHKDGICYYNEYCGGTLIGSKSHIEEPICNDPDGVSYSSTISNAIDWFTFRIFNGAECCLEDCGCPDLTSDNSEELIDVGESCRNYESVSGFEYLYILNNLTPEMTWYEPRPLDEAVVLSAPCRYYSICRFDLKLVGGNATPWFGNQGTGTFEEIDENGCSVYDCGGFIFSTSRKVCPDQLAEEVGVDPGDLNLDCIPEIGQIYDFIMNHQDYKDNLANYNGSDVADLVDDLRDNNSYLDIQNIECATITFCIDNYDVIRFYPFTANTYCNDKCVLFSSSCDDIVNVDEDQQDRINETSCADGDDNDGDGLIDCADGDCLIQLAQAFSNLKLDQRKFSSSCPVLDEALVDWVLENQNLINYHQLSTDEALWLYENPILSDRLVGSDDDLPVLIAWILRRAAQGAVAVVADVLVQITLEYFFGNYDSWIDAAINTDIDWWDAGVSGLTQAVSGGLGKWGQAIAGAVEGAIQALNDAPEDISDQEAEVILSNAMGGAIVGIISSLVGETAEVIVAKVGKYGFDPVINRIKYLGVWESLISIADFRRILIREFWKNPATFPRGLLLEEILTFSKYSSPFRWVGPLNKSIDYIDDLTGFAVDLKTVKNLRNYRYSNIRNILDGKLAAFNNGEFSEFGISSLQIDFMVPPGYNVDGLDENIAAFFDQWYSINSSVLPEGFPRITFIIGENLD